MQPDPSPSKTGRQARPFSLTSLRKVPVSDLDRESRRHAVPVPTEAIRPPATPFPCKIGGMAVAACSACGELLHGWYPAGTKCAACVRAEREARLERQAELAGPRRYAVCADCARRRLNAPTRAV